jgi:leucine-rich repeat-containing G protein-coupled receptor 7
MCVAPTDEISSCDDLLRSETYRAFLWLISVLSLTGNAFCVIFRSLLHRASSRNAFNAFVTSLCLADLLMGVYVTIIGAANAAFHGTYLLRDMWWLSSAACSAAGVLACCPARCLR